MPKKNATTLSIGEIPLGCGGEVVPSPTIIMQRIRNRIMDYLEVASSLQKQREYEAHRVCDVPYEMINEWEEWVSGDLADYGPPVFSSDEQAAVRDYQAVWLKVIDDTPDPLPTLQALVGAEPWERLRRAAEVTLQTFMQRGRFDEDLEVFAA